jgi:hypothetical protein
VLVELSVDLHVPSVRVLLVEFEEEAFDEHVVGEVELVSHDGGDGGGSLDGGLQLVAEDIGLEDDEGVSLLAVLQHPVNHRQQQGVKQALVLVVPRLLLFLEELAAVTPGVLAQLLVRPRNAGVVEGPIPFLELVLSLVYQVNQEFQQFRQSLLIHRVDVLYFAPLHLLGQVHHCQTHQQRKQTPGWHQKVGLALGVLEGEDHYEEKVEQTHEDLDPHQHFFEVKVVAVEAEEEAREGSQVAGVGDAHDDEEEQLKLEGLVVEKVDHGGDLDNKSAETVPVGGAGHEAAGEGVAVIVVHGVEDVDEEQPEEVESPQDRDEDLHSLVALLGGRVDAAGRAVEGCGGGLEDGDGQHGGVEHHEEVDEVLCLVLVEVAFGHLLVDAFGPLLEGPVAQPQQHHAHHI